MKGRGLDWGVAAQAFPGERRSGDRHVLIERETNVIMAVVDGIGHGDDAADAATAAVAAIEEYADESVERLFCRCHENLSDTRGAAMTLCSFDRVGNRLTWLGAGNVTAVLARADREAGIRCRDLLVRSGVVGSQLPALSSSCIDIADGDLLVLATDGIGARFIEALRPLENVQRQAERILSDFRLSNDDALVLVVRFDGGNSP